MNKYLLILFAVLTCITGYAGVDDWTHANPFAYNLRSSFSATGDTLFFYYTLNDQASNNTTYNDKRGLQIYLLDEHGNRVLRKNGQGIYNGKFLKGENKAHVLLSEIPDEYKDKPLGWEVVVHGNKNWTKPKVIAASSKQPKNAHGVAINSDTENKYLGQMFISEGYPSTTDNKNSLLEFSATLDYKLRIKKQVHDDNTNSWFSSSPNYEPHRVKMASNGRLFVTCYHPTAAAAVLEYKGNHTFKTIIKPTKDVNGTDPKECRRVVGMDVKGEGDDLKIVLAWIDPDGNTVNEQKGAKIEIYEYAIGQAEKNGATPLNQIVGTSTTSPYVTKIAEYGDCHPTTSSPGLLYTGYDNTWNSYHRGFVDVAYGANNDIWMKVDYSYQVAYPGRIILFRDGNTVVTTMNQDDAGGGYYGGNGIFYDSDTKMIITGAGGNQIKMYSINDNGSLNQPSKYTITDTRVGHWVTAFAKDHANNLYAITRSSGSAATFTANVLAIAMPYDGTRTTRAKGTVTLSDPIPNILATDLRFSPAGFTDQYTFSFNVNTKPKLAQIRFYSSYDDMKKSINVVHADNYNGKNTNKPSFVYNIPTDNLRQGNIAVQLAMCGGKLSGEIGSEGCELLNDALPPGEWYWSVYVQAPRQSNVFAPIYRQKSDGEDAHNRLHATVNNYPETDMFGAIIAAQYNGSGEKGLMIYGFNPNGKSIDENTSISNDYRYKLVNKYVNPSTGNRFENQRRLAVAPDGKVFIADYGYTTSTPIDKPVEFANGGIWVWDPKNQPQNNQINLSFFLQNNNETTNGLAIYDHGTDLKLYGTNTYTEFTFHESIYTDFNAGIGGIFGGNGIKEYKLGDINNVFNIENNATTKTYGLGEGDGNGNMSIVATDKGIWMAQHRLNDVQYAIDAFENNINETKTLAFPDNQQNITLSFVPYNSTIRTWKSCNGNGVTFDVTTRTWNYKADASDLTQKTTSPLQACPGAGLAYKKINGKEFLYIVNHQGNIVVLEITNWSSNTPTVVYRHTLPTIGAEGTNDGGRPFKAISTMNFDYAGNLVTTTGNGYLDAVQDIIVYTMPYDRVNAQEIQAPNSCRYIPERMSQTYAGHQEIITPYLPEQNGGTQKSCGLDFYRPMRSDAFNTICLPFDMTETQIAASPYKNAEILQYTNAELINVSGEDMVYLNFETVNAIEAGKPYLLKPKDMIRSIIRFDKETVGIKPSTTDSVHIPMRSFANTTDAQATYQGIFDKKTWTLADVEENLFPIYGLVGDNRLAQVTSLGDMMGFRGYFRLTGIPISTPAFIAQRKNTPTDLTNTQAETIDIEKYMREGRIYIRVGEHVYNMNGEMIK